MKKQRLTENFSIAWGEPLKLKKLPLQESTKSFIFEGKERSVLQKWEVPVWRLDKKNLNDRVYRKSLAERIIKEFGDVVTACLADHPSGDEGSVKDILGVAKNPHIREGIMYVDAYIVDEAFEKKLEKMIETGYGLGVSSSVLGEVDEDGFVIDESVELDRYFDFVLNPSYQVYITKESITENSLKEEKTLTIDNVKEIKKMSIDKVNKLMEKTTRLNIEKLVKEACEKEKISDKIEALEDTLSYVDDEFLPELKTEIEEKLAIFKKESYELAEKGKKVDELEKESEEVSQEKEELEKKIEDLEKENSELNDKLDTAVELMDEMKEHIKVTEKVVVSLEGDVGSRFSAQEFIEAVEGAKEDKEEVEKEVEELEKENKELEEEIKDLETENKEIREAHSKVLKNNKNLREKVKKLEKKIEEAVNDYTDDIEDGLMNEDDDIYDTPNFNFEKFRAEKKKEELELDLQGDDVEEYYDDLVAEDARYESIKDVILGCKTLLEAQRLAIRLRSTIEKLPETKRRKAITRQEERYIPTLKEGVDVKTFMPKGWL